MKTEADKLDFERLAISVVLSEKQADYGRGYNVQMLYVPESDSYIFIENMKTKELETYKINTKKLTIEELYNLSDDDNTLNLMKRLVMAGINKSDVISDNDNEKVNDIVDKLLNSLYELSWSDESDKEEIVEILEMRKRNIEEAFNNDGNDGLKEHLIKIDARIDARMKEEELFELQLVLGLIDSEEGRFKYGFKKDKLYITVASYLVHNENIMLQKKTQIPYKLDINNSYNKMEPEELYLYLCDLLGTSDHLSLKELEKSLDYISIRKDPQYNIIKFNNCLYDISTFEKIEQEEPVFTLMDIPYNLNPEAKGYKMQEYLHSSLEDDTEERTQEKIKGLKQLIGYCFTSGNPLNAFPCITGVQGGGKSVLTNILYEIFGGKEYVSDIKIQDLSNPNHKHATAGLVGKRINIMQETDNLYIEHDGMIKQLTGYDPINVEPKFKNPYTLDKRQVPKMMLVSNTLPKFKNPSGALLQRIIVVEFKKIFRGTDNANPKLLEELLEDPDNIEWLIFESINEYREMVKAGEDFILRISEEENLNLLNKHSRPLEYLVKKLFLRFDEEAFRTEVEELKNDDVYVFTDELKQNIIRLGKEEGLQVPLNNNGEISSRKLMNAIKNVFDLHYFIDKDGKAYTTGVTRVNGKTKRHYPYLLKSEHYKIVR